MQEATIAVPTSIVVWILGLLAAAFISGLTFCGHMLISIKTGMNKMALEWRDMDSRVKTLERHDEKNQTQSDLMLKKILETA